MNKIQSIACESYYVSGKAVRLCLSFWSYHLTPSPLESKKNALDNSPTHLYPRDAAVVIPEIAYVPLMARDLIVIREAVWPMDVEQRSSN